MKPLLNMIINPLPLIAITVKISSKLLWQHTRNSCSLPQNSARELPRGTPSHILIIYLTGNRRRHHQRQWTTAELVVPQDLYPSPNQTEVCWYTNGATGKKSYSQQLPGAAVTRTTFLICGSDPAQHEQFKRRLLKIPSPCMGSWSSCNCSSIASVWVTKTSCLCASIHPRNSCANTFFYC